MTDENITELAEFQAALVYNAQVNKALDAILFVHKYQQIAARSLFILGDPGVGKSAILQRYVDSVTENETDEVSPKKAIYIAQTTNLSNEALASAILEKLGDPQPSQGKFAEQMKRIKNYKDRLGLQLVVIDEIQELMPTRSLHDRSKVISFIKLLMNTIGVAVVVGGLHKAENILFVDEQIRTRTTESIHIQPFNMKTDYEVKRYAQFIKEIMTKYPAKIPGLFSKSGEGLCRLLLATKGNNRVFKNLLAYAFSISESKDSISMDCLHLAWQPEASKPFATKNAPFKSTIKAVKDELRELGLL